MRCGSLPRRLPSPQTGVRRRRQAPRPLTAPPLPPPRNLKTRSVLHEPVIAPVLAALWERSRQLVGLGLFIRGIFGSFEALHCKLLGLCAPPPGPPRFLRGSVRTGDPEERRQVLLGQVCRRTPRRTARGTPRNRPTRVAFGSGRRRPPAKKESARKLRRSGGLLGSAAAARQPRVGRVALAATAQKS